MNELMHEMYTRTESGNIIVYDSQSNIQTFKGDDTLEL